MKAVPLIFLFLLLLAAAGGSWHLVQSSDRGRLFDLAENTLYRMTEATGTKTTTFEHRLNAKLGACEASTMARPESGGYTIQAPQFRRIPFSLPFLLKDFAIICMFPGTPASVKITPQTETTLLVRREPGQAEIAVRSGAVVLTSDQLSLTLRMRGMQVKLASAEPVRLKVTDTAEMAEIFALLGRLEIAAGDRHEGEEEVQPVHLYNAPEGAFKSGGKEVRIREGFAQLLPSGELSLPEERPK